MHKGLLVREFIMQFIFFFLILSTIEAALFVPIPLKTQIAESDGFVHGKFVEEKYKRSRTGQVLTEASFEVIYSSGDIQKSLINNNLFKVIYPGGKWQGVIHRVSGAPSFKQSEEVVLLIKNTNEGPILHNLGLGKYNIIRENKSVFLKSSIFPNHPELGKINYTKLQLKLINKRGKLKQKRKRGRS